MSSAAAPTCRNLTALPARAGVLAADDSTALVTTTTTTRAGTTGGGRMGVSE